MEVKIALTEKEQNDAYLVRKVVFVEEQNVPLEEEIDQYEQDSTHFVVYDQHDPIAAGRFRIIDGYGKVERICVLSSYRSKGVGKLLMDMIESVSSDKGISKLKLNAQTHAIPFYERLNYHVVSDEFMDAGIPHRTMEKLV